MQVAWAPPTLSTPGRLKLKDVSEEKERQEKVKVSVKT
jgi:hypothetical protein